MQLGCRLKSLNVTIKQALSLVSQAGFAQVELDWPTVKRELAQPGGTITGLPVMLEENDLTVGAVHLGSASADRPDRKTLQMRRLKEDLPQIAAIGTPLVLLTAGRRTVESFNLLKDILAELADEVAASGMTLAVTNEVNTRLENRQDLLALFLGDLPNTVGLCLDVHQFHLAAVNPGDLIIEHGGRIRAVRLSDAMGTTPTMPGQGEIELRGLIGQLRELDYKGPIFADQIPQPANLQLEETLRSIRRFYEGLIKPR